MRLDIPAASMIPATPDPAVIGALLRSGIAIVGALAVAATVAFGQTKDVDHIAVLEIGGAADWGLTAGPSSLGGTVAVEVTPIEHWLELEAGVTAFGTNGRREVSTDLLFKKPYQLSSALELMVGAGPEFSWKLSGPHHTRSVAAELALDAMFWPTRNLGWYVEPSYNFSGLRAKSDRSLGVTAGLIIGVP
jgi:hypothetical protein